MRGMYQYGPSGRALFCLSSHYLHLFELAHAPSPLQQLLEQSPSLQQIFPFGWFVEPQCAFTISEYVSVMKNMRCFSIFIFLFLG